MSLATWSLIVGLGGALITTLSFWPQLVKVRRQGAHDLSLAMLGMYLGGAILWLVYGLLNDATAVIAANIVALVLVSTIAVMKIRFDRRGVAPRRLRIGIDMDEVMADALDRAPASVQRRVPGVPDGRSHARTTPRGVPSRRISARRPKPWSTRTSSRIST